MELLNSNKINEENNDDFKISRRDFLKLTASVGIAAALSNTIGASEVNIKNAGTSPKFDGKIVYSVCPYCAVGCGMKIYVKDGKVVHIEGDEENPINRGSLCSKGNAAIQQIYNDFRVKHPLKRIGNGQWQKISWDEAIDEISEKLKEIKEKYGANAVGFYGCSHATNEEDYLIQKIARIFGTNNIEHQARKCHASTVGALAPSFGRGAMTNHWIDIKNAKSIFIIGSNIVENHPVGFQWVMEAREKNNAKIVVADPRFTKTANKADIHLQHRPGTDIALINGICNEIIKNKKYDENYLMNRTNAPFLVREEDGKVKLIEININPIIENKKIKIVSTDPSDNAKIIITGKDENGKDINEEIYLDGKNFVESKNKFSFITKIENERSLGEIQILDESDKEISKIPANVKVYGDCYGAYAGVFTAQEMETKETVFRKLVENVSTYTLEEVEKITWVEKEKIKEAAKIFSENKPMTILYSMGATQHTTGVQYIRSYVVLQLLLGNIGVPGGGINAMRGIHNVQGATDMGLCHILPGYLRVPGKDEKLSEYWASLGKLRLGKYRQDEIFNILTDQFPEDKFSGHKGGKGNGLWGISYEQLPKGPGYSTQVMIRKAKEGKIKALIIFGENPMVSSPNLNLVKEAFKNLELLVVVDIFESESAAAERNENSLTYLLPASTFAEKAGSVTNSGRCVQWRYKAIDPLYESKSDLEILINLAKKLYEKGVLNFDKNRFANWKDAFNYVFNYGYDPENGNFDNEKVAENVLNEIVKCCWIYNTIGKFSGVIETRDKDEFGDEVINKGTNYAKRRDNVSDNGEGIYPGWGWTWPINRHVLYYVHKEKGKNLEIEYKFKDDRYRPNKRGIYVIPNDGFLTKEGVAALGALTAPLKDGFLPKHMEPIESPYPDLVQKYPPFVKFDPDPNKNTSNVGELEIGDAKDFPYVLTTFRLLEHMLAGQLTRNLPYLVELEPEPFCEINEKLANEKGIKNNDYVKISTKRGSIKVRARINGRVNDKTVAVTWHWGFKGLATGDSANYLTIDAVDPNANIPEYKVGLCNIEKA